MKKIIIMILLALAFMLTACSEDQDQSSTLTISAAISLTEALEEIQELYEAEHDTDLSFNLAGSGTLAQQIQQGAPVDLFISANAEWMDKLEQSGDIHPATREVLVNNELVLIGKKDTEILPFTNAEDFDSTLTVAIGNPDSVPAGNYTKQSLEGLGVWDQIEDNLVLAKDVRQVLTYVETGNADIGYVYKSDALSSDKVEILATVESDLHDPIVYPAALIKASEKEEEAKDFMQFLLSDEAQEIFEQYGFH